MNTLAILALLGVILICLKTYKRSRRPSPPPGPKGLPILGNIALKLPEEEKWKAFAEMAKEYGDMVYLEVFGQSLLILNTVRRASDLFEKRSANYSSRPYSTMLHELMGAGFMVVVMRYGDAWRRRRRLLHTYIRKTDSEEFRSIQMGATGTLLKDLAQSPQNFPEHIKKHSGTIILKLVYGYDVKEGNNDPLVQIVEDANVRILEAFRDGPWLVDIFPFLRHIPAWIPGAKFQHLAAEGARSIGKMLNKPFYDVKARMVDKTAEPCLVTECLGEIEGRDDVPQDQEEVIKDAAAVAYSGGVDTTSSSISTFILAMILYPEIQRKAQAELDSIVGRDRVPTYEDRPHLPYIQCVALETARWQPVTPLGVPHVSMADDVYEGYHIPAGTIIMPNVWSIFRDEEVYPDPETFNPDRFLALVSNTDSNKRDLPPDPTSVAFGFGRRICPGRNLAQDTVWIAIASILSKFTITNALDENGEKVVPEIQYTSTAISQPKPFQCRFIPRV